MIRGGLSFGEVRVVEPLRLKFDPMTIEHLGFKMYSHLPNAIAELVANSYDADAASVTVAISEDGASLIVADDGHGMSIEELQENYLVIGRNRRLATKGEFSESGRRRVAGRKGLGKLAVFGIGNRITIETKRAGSDYFVEVEMVWGDIKGATGAEYQPRVSERPAHASAHFTRVRIEDLNRKTSIKPRELAESLARLFNYQDVDFELTVKQGREEIPITRDLRYAAIDKEAEWRIPDHFRVGVGSEAAPRATGRIIASRRPLPAHLRGVTLYVRGRMANEPEYFGVPESSHAFSYITGYVDADDLDSAADVISTDRRSVSWDSADAIALHSYLAEVVREAARKRRAIRETENKKSIDKDIGADLKTWTSTIKGPESAAVERVLETLVSADNDIEVNDRKAIVEGLREIAPDYADLHWRALHPSIQEAAEREYKSENYHHAVVEAIKRYVKNVRKAASVSADMKELDVLNSSFLGDAPAVDVALPYTSMNLAAATKRDMREGQKQLSSAVWTGFRNILQHEEIVELKAAGAFSYQDCLDALSIVSHLQRRVEAATQAAEDDDLPASA